MRNAASSSSSDENGSGRSGVQAIARAAAVLRALECVPEGLSLSELAAATELPKSTAHRIVSALAAEQLVAHERGAVRLGAAAARLGAASGEALGERLRPLLLGLRRELDETVDLAVLDGAHVRFVGQVPAPRRLRATSSVGELFPLHCTANGKALLAVLPPERTLELLPTSLPRLTPQTIVSRERLLEELATVREQGVAFDREEHTEGICAVGAVVAYGGVPVAAISVPVPSQRFSSEEAHIVRATAATAKAAGAQLAAR